MKDIRNVSFFLLIFLASGCKKKDLTYPTSLICEGNCAVVQLSGRVLNISSNKGLPLYPVEVLWKDLNHVYSYSTFVTKGKTDKNGNFYFKLIIDTSEFKYKHLAVRVSNLENFITIPSNEKGISSYDFYDYSPVHSNLNFQLYTPAKLTLNINRTQQDSFTYFLVRHWFKTNFLYTDFVAKRDTHNVNINTVTAANLYTIIEWGKWYSNGDTINHTDSIICEKDKQNTYNIDW